MNADDADGVDEAECGADAGTDVAPLSGEALVAEGVHELYP
jgi:hypothetical protein